MQITAQQARSIIAAGEACAREIGIPVNIAVLDTGTQLKAFSRMDGALVGSIDIAVGKARTSALFQMPTDVYKSRGYSHHLNSLPRKCLGYKTPAEVFVAHLRECG